MILSTETQVNQVLRVEEDPSKGNKLPRALVVRNRDVRPKISLYLTFEIEGAEPVRIFTHEVKALRDELTKWLNNSRFSEPTKPKSSIMDEDEDDEPEEIM